MRLSFLLVIVLAFSAFTFASDISSLIEDLGTKSKAKDASEALARIGKPAVPALIKALSDKDRHRGRYAARALRQIGQDAADAIPALSAALSDADVDTRGYAVEALSNMTDRGDQVLSILERTAQKDSDQGVRKTAEKAIAKIKASIAQRIALEDQKKEHLRQQLTSDNNTKVKDKNSALLNEAIGLYTGTSGKVDYETAKKLFLQLCNDGDPLGSMWSAKCYQKGLCGFPTDITKANEITSKVIEQVKQIAIAGNPEAAFLLGSAHHFGLIVDRSYPNAMEWYRRAAERGNSSAMNNLGGMFYNGEGVKEDLKEAVKWYRKAAELGHCFAMLNLSKAYAEGKGIEKDDTKAAEWLQKAKEKGMAGIIPEKSVQVAASGDKLMVFGVPLNASLQEVVNALEKNEIEVSEGLIKQGEFEDILRKEITNAYDNRMSTVSTNTCMFNKEAALKLLDEHKIKPFCVVYKGETHEAYPGSIISFLYNSSICPIFEEYCDAYNSQVHLRCEQFPAQMVTQMITSMDIFFASVHGNEPKSFLISLRTSYFGKKEESLRSILARKYGLPKVNPPSPECYVSATGMAYESGNPSYLSSRCVLFPKVVEVLYTGALSSSGHYGFFSPNFASLLRPFCVHSDYPVLQWNRGDTQILLLEQMSVSLAGNSETLNYVYLPPIGPLCNSYEKLRNASEEAKAKVSESGKRGF